MRENVEAAAWPHRALTVSIGAASVFPGADAASLLERCDAALYRARGAGRNRVAVAEAD